MRLVARATGRRRKRARRRLGMQPRAKERLANIYIAESGDQALVHECRFERRLAAAEEARDDLARQLVAERLDAHIAEVTTLAEGGARREIHEAEAARVIIYDGG